MFIIITNHYNDEEERNEKYNLCGYLKIDDEKPMKITSIRIFKIQNGFHKFQYTSSQYHSHYKEFTHTGNEKDILSITVYAPSTGIKQEPDFRVLEANDETYSDLTYQYEVSKQIIQESYDRAIRSLEESAQSLRNKGYSQHMVDDALKTHKVFIKMIDLRCCLATEEYSEWVKNGSKAPPKTSSYAASSSSSSSSSSTNTSSGGCYVATCVYGSYDCPEVWTLRRYRDNTLAATWYGRLFIQLYYTISPTIVKIFGNTKWFKRFWKDKLDKKIQKLQAEGLESTPYSDKNW